MTKGLSGIEEDGKGKKLSSVEVQDKSRPGDCSFCWFVLKLYPDLERMTSRDSALFAEHLKMTHGLREEIKS